VQHLWLSNNLYQRPMRRQRWADLCWLGIRELLQLKRMVWLHFGILRNRLPIRLRNLHQLKQRNFIDY